MRFMVHNASGEVLRSGECPANMLSIQGQTGETVIEIPETVDAPEAYYVAAGELVAKPARPSPHHRFDYTTKQWIDPRTLADFQQAKHAEIDAARRAAEVAPVTVNGRPFPATEEFQAKISRALNYVGRGKPLDLTGAWRDSTASPVDMTPTLLGQIEDAITAQGVAAWKRYWTRFDSVAAATTPAEVEAVVWG